MKTFFVFFPDIFQLRCGVSLKLFEFYTVLRRIVTKNLHCCLRVNSDKPSKIIMTAEGKMIRLMENVVCKLDQDRLLARKLDAFQKNEVK